MKLTRFNRIFAALLSVLFLCASVPAQLELGGRRMAVRPTPTLTNRTQLRTGLGIRPRIGLVARVGGVSSDGVATPDEGLTVNTIVPSYSATRPDGQRLSVTINGQTVTAPIYDWQLIPIAKFADSEFFSCFTMFGAANDEQSAQPSTFVRPDDYRYHADFKDTLVGLRFFQLDGLFLHKDNTDLVKDGGRYILGAGESAPNLAENDKGWDAFEKRRENEEDLWRFNSYVISDYRRSITFGIDQNKLRIKGEPYVYFWRIDPESKGKFLNGEAQEAVEKSLGSAARYSKAVLINKLVAEIGKYHQLTEGTGFLRHYLPELDEVLFAPASQRASLLRTKSRPELFELLVELRAFNSLDWTIEMRELSDRVSSDTAALRAINPAVWDTGVNLVRYAPFFRYIKQQKPQQWQAFMRQINAAPPPKPPVVTPSGFER